MKTVREKFGHDFLAPDISGGANRSPPERYQQIDIYEPEDQVSGAKLQRQY